MDNNDKYYIERATEILKEVYKKEMRNLPQVDEVRKRFLEGKSSIDKLAKEFNMRSEEVLQVLREDIKNRKK